MSTCKGTGTMWSVGLATWFVLSCAATGGQSGTEAIDVTGGKKKPDAGDLEQADGGSPIIRRDSGALPRPTNDASQDDAGSPVEPEVPGPMDTTPLNPDPGPTSPEQTDTFSLRLDYYQVPCPFSFFGGAGWCPRGAVDDEPDFRPSSSYGWENFEWGHSYSLVAQWREIPDPPEDGNFRELVVVEVVEDEPVAAGTRFTVQIDPTLESLGLGSFLLYDPNTEEASLGSGPAFTFDRGELDLLGQQRSGVAFDATFEFDAELAITLVGLTPLPDVTTTLALEMMTLEGDWQSRAPTQYVVKVCSTGFLPPSCTLTAVDDGTIVSAELGGREDPWQPSSPESEPLTAMFDGARFAIQFEVNPDYGYISSYTRANLSESWGEAVRCFAPDTLDLEVCRDVE